MSKAIVPLKVLSIAVNVFVAALFWTVANDPKASAEIQDVTLAPAIIIGVSLFLLYYYYQGAAFVYRILEGTPLDHAKVGGKEEWQKFMLGVNKEANKMLRAEGIIPFEWIANRVINNSHPLQPVVWISAAALSLAFVYAGWFWTGLVTLAATVVEYRTHVYLRANVLKIKELMQM